MKKSKKDKAARLSASAVAAALVDASNTKAPQQPRARTRGRGRSSPVVRSQSVPTEPIAEEPIRSSQPPEDARQEPRYTRFEYTVVYAMRLQGSKEPMPASSRKYDTATDFIDDPVKDCNTWCDNRIAEMPQHVIARKLLYAHFERLSKDHWIPGAIEDWPILIGQLKEWHFASKKGLTIRIDVVVKDEAIQLPPQPSQSRSRGGATARQHAILPVEREAMEVISGNYSSEIQRLWTCTQKGCRNYNKGCCYWLISNEPSRHFPITQPVLQRWSEGIREGKLTAKEPSNLMQEQLRVAKEDAEGGPPSRRRKESQPQPVAAGVNLYLNSSTGTVMPMPQLAAPPTSSPYRSPSGSPRGSSMERLESFISWCKEDPSWRGEETELDETLLLLKSNRVDLTGLTRMNDTAWSNIGLLFGYKDRLTRWAKLFKVNGGGRAAAPPA